jgi:hypothetical protein
VSAKIESPSRPFPPEMQEVVLLETLKELLTATIRSLSRGEPAELADLGRSISATADEVTATELTLCRSPLTAAAQQQRQKLLAELRQQRSFCRAMLRRWRRSIVLRQQLLDLATGTATYSEALDPRGSCHE